MKSSGDLVSQGIDGCGIDLLRSTSKGSAVMLATDEPIHPSTSPMDEMKKYRGLC